MQNAADLEYCNYVDSISKDVEHTYTIQLQYLKQINTVDSALQ